MKTFMTIITSIILSSCSLFGIQNEESPHYKVLHKDGDFEIREYDPYIVAKVRLKGSSKDNTSKGFRILAGYIFGKNEGKNKISMTAPVEMKQESVKIAMTSPVEMVEEDNTFTMTFSMPSKYTLETLPKAKDKRITFESVPKRLKASHRFTWFRTESRLQAKYKELRAWLNKQKDYQALEGFSFAGYNPPWTIPFLRRNEVHIELKK